jgi:hypothetical protein
LDHLAVGISTLCDVVNAITDDLYRHHTARVLQTVLATT